eukprot:12398777-Karenia_brevis.AAC.1
MVSQMRAVLEPAGLFISTETGKNLVMQVTRSTDDFDPEAAGLGSELVLGGIPFKKVADMKILGAMVSCDDTQSCELEFRLDKGLRAFYANARQLLCSRCSIQTRLGLLYKMVGQTMLFGTETLALTEDFVSRMCGAYSGYVVKMLNLKRKKDEEVEEYLIRTRGAAKSELLRHGTYFRHLLYARQWRYLGHTLRSSGKISSLVQFRSPIWWKAQETLSLTKKRHRRSGAQNSGPLAALIKLAMQVHGFESDGQLKEAANDRRNWTQLWTSVAEMLP